MASYTIPKREEYPELDSPRRKYIAILKERKSFLEGQIQEDPDRPGISYRVGEQAALEWVLNLIDTQFKGPN